MAALQLTAPVALPFGAYRTIDCLVVPPVCVDCVFAALVTRIRMRIRPSRPQLACPGHPPAS